MNALVKHKTFFDFFPVPDFLLLATSGIAISDDSVKLVELKRGSGKSELELLHEESIALPLGAVEAGFIKQKEEVIKALKSLAQKYNLRYVRASLPEEKSYLFTSTLSDVTVEGLRDAVAFIIEENAPVTLADSVFDFEVLDWNEEKSEVKVVVSVVSKKVVDAYSEVFEAAGIMPVAFDIESQAISRAVVLEGDTRAQLIINLGEKKTGLYVVENGLVQFSLTPSLGVRGESPYPDLNDLRTEVRKLFTFWNTRLNKQGVPESKIERVIVVGPGAVNKDFITTLMTGIGVEYVWANVWTNVFSLKRSIPKLSFEESLSFAPAIGLALAQRKNHV
jgi:hypothetical protein